ncbi:hypothetical protein P7K49_006312 [Saguinus oedipus]|uniref:Uncharacterized protein n=1 Tax=Saguinus oedipus TaxID=9490 RepID=A0ABQ9W2U0_SAGOE|nr:hypothetical protein P7K49_006312 [Saguinus oedipus]
MEPEEGTPLWQLQKLPAERGPQRRGAGALGRSGLRLRPRKGGGRGVISGVRSPPPLGSLGGQLGAPPLRPGLEVQLQGLSAQKRPEAPASDWALKAYDVNL